MKWTVAGIFALVVGTGLAGQTPTSGPGGVSTRPSFQVAPEPPGFSEADLALLVKTARTAFREHLQGKPEQAARYTPPALRGVRAILHLTLRQFGAALAEVETKDVELVDGALAAGVMLGRAVEAKKIRLVDFGDGCGLEFEWLGPIEYVAATNDALGKWTDALLHSFEPGREGIGVEFRGRRGWTRPSQIIALNLNPDLALQAAEKAVELEVLDKSRHAKDVKYFRFRTRHAWQADAVAHRMPVELIRGETYVRPETVTEQGLSESIHRMGRYLKYRQNSDGWYSEEYLPSGDRYSLGNSAAVQMHALQGLAAYAAWSGDAAIAEAAAKGIGRSAVFLTPLVVPKDPSASQPTSGPTPTTQAGQVLAFPGHGDHLNLSARLLMGMLELKGHAEFAPRCAGVVDAILASQDVDGRLEMAFDAASEGAPENAYAAGEAMQALARASADRRDDRIDRCLQLAERHYQQWYEKHAEPMGAAALCRALAQGYAITNDARASDFAFRILDELVRLQLDATSSPWPELHGAINTKEPGLIGVDTASYLLALSDGLSMARRIGDARRVERYRAAALAAARFVMQLEVGEAGAYYARSRVDVLGGVRRAPWNNTIRADSCAEALMSLIEAKRALFDKPGR